MPRQPRQNKHHRQNREHMKKPGQRLSGLFFVRDGRQASPHPCIVVPFSDLAGGDRHCIRMQGIDQDIALLRNDHGRHQQQCGNATCGPGIAKIETHLAGGYCVPSDRLAALNTTAAFQTASRISMRTSYRFSGSALAFTCTKVSKLAKAMFSAQQRGARPVPAPASDFRAGPGKIVGGVIRRIKGDAPRKPAQA